MSTESSSAKWWQTLPGILTAITATITATAGLIAVLHQTGLLPNAEEQPTSAARPTAANPLPVPSSSLESSTTTTAGVSTATKLILPANTQVKLPVGNGRIVYTLLDAQLEPYNSENRALKLRIRAFNDYSYSVNFWDRSFRLAIAGTILSPSNSLNELVDAQTTREGDIVFTIPLSAQQAILTIGEPGQVSTQMALDLGSATSGN